jgi:hypothetical protein
MKVDYLRVDNLMNAERVAVSVAAACPYREMDRSWKSADTKH